MIWFSGNDVFFPVGGRGARFSVPLRLHPPQANGVNFAPRSCVPTLMIDGSNDFLNPYEIAQRPFFRLLGARENERRQARLEGGHLPRPRVLSEEALSWLDRYLGPVASTNAATEG